MNSSLRKCFFCASCFLFSLHMMANPGSPPDKAVSGKNNATGTLSAIFWMEDFILSDGVTTDTGPTAWQSSYTGSGNVVNRFSVLNQEFRVNNITVNGVGTWSSEVIDITGKMDIGISVDVRSGVAPGGTLDDDNSEHYDYVRMYYRIDGGEEVLFSEHRGAINGNSISFTNVSTGTVLSGSSLQVIIRARATATDEFYYFDNVAIAGTDAVSVDALASANDVLTCTNTIVNLSGSSTASGVSYSWTGPNGFTSADQNPAVTVPGIYTLTVSSGSATATDTALVVQDITAPGGLSAFSSNTITCFQSTANLNGTSTTPGVTYSWAGPGGFTANTAAATVSAGGIYTFVVTKLVNGCTDTALVTVSQNVTKPANVSASNDGPLTCMVTEVTITGSSSTPGMDYFWTGPDDYFSFSDVDIVTVPGDYVLIVTNLSNGCSDTVSTIVEEDYSTCSNAARTMLQQQVSMSREKAGNGQLLFRAYPNPVRGNGFVEFTATQNGPVKVGIYNTLGVCEKVLFSSNANAGQLYKLPFNSSGLPGAVYYYVISTPGKQYAQKLMLVK